MRFTVAIPTHNNEDIIMQCISHVLELEYDDYEVLVSDTSNSSHTYNMIEELHNERIRIYQNDSSWSMWENHNFLLTEAHGDYILFIHSDDIVLPDALIILDSHLALLKYPSRIILSGTSIYKNFQENLRHLGLETERLITGTDAILLFSNNGMSPSGLMFSSDIREKGGFVGDSMILPYTDCWTELNCALNGYRFYFIDNILFLRSTNGTKLRKGSKRELKETFEKLMDIFNESQIKVIIKSAVIERGHIILDHFAVSNKYKKEIRMNSLRYILLHPIKYRKLFKFLF